MARASAPVLAVVLLLIHRSAEQNPPMCTLQEVGERLMLLQSRLAAGTTLFPGGPTVKSERVTDIFADPRVGEIPSIAAEDTVAARALVLQNMPFVIRAVPSVNALQRRWTQEYLRNETASTPMFVYTYKDKMLDFLDGKLWVQMKTQDPKEARRIMAAPGFQERASRNMSWMFNYAERHRNSDNRMVYALTNAFPDQKAARDALERFVPPMKEQSLQNPFLRIGFNELHYSAHFDYTANYLAQVAGVKRVVMFSPVEEEKLHWVRDSAHPHFRHSRVWPRLNLKRDSKFPDFMMAEALQATLQPGDVIFIPPLWFHYLEAKMPAASDNSGNTTLPFWLNINAFANMTSDGAGQAMYICPHNKNGAPIRSRRKAARGKAAP